MLTGVVLARNEEAHIAACLESLRPHVEELILIDMQSEDRTVERARPLVDQVLSHPLIEHFDAARNVAIDAATHDWLWYLDADERVPAETGQLVRRLITEQGDQFAALVIPFKSYFCGQWMRHCGWWPGYTMPRVMRKGQFRFREEVHGGVEVDGRQLFLPAEPRLGIDHYSYRDVRHYLEKFNRYTSSEAQKLAAQQVSWDWREATRTMVRELWQDYEAGQGDLDGARGWILSWLSAQYRWVSHAKLLTDQAGPAPREELPNFPATLDEVFQVCEEELAHARARHPRSPLGLVWRSPIEDPSGYADEGRTFVKALARGERPLRLEPLRWSDATCELPPAETALYRALRQARRAPWVATLTDCIPTLCQPDPAASLNILRTTFETDRIPEHWLPRLAGYDEIWVISRHNEAAFRRSGVPPEKLRRVPSFLDTEWFTPEGPRLTLPEAMQGRFTFLSLFDWQLRKGWDVLLSAYAQAFQPEDQAGLLLKITHVHGHRWEDVRAQADALLATLGQSLEARPDIRLWNEELSAADLAALYRSVDAFVLPSRGEGWGRPYMEAMASGLPVIGTAASGNVDFMQADNSYLIPATLVDVPPEAGREIPVYARHRWYEPDGGALQATMREVFEDTASRQAKAVQGRAHLLENFSLEAGLAQVEQALQAAEARFHTPRLPPVRPEQVRLTLEGELCAGHSFAHVNEQLALGFSRDPELALSLARVQRHPTQDAQSIVWPKLKPYLGRELPGGPDVTIRHAFPPDWQKPPQGAWVHIQPWEFGHLPRDWVVPLRDEVDEIWAPSHYVRQVYEQSGIPPEKIQVIPWGIDPEVYHPGAEPQLLPGEGLFRFLFVGGTIPRKGFDRLLEAFLAEFTREDPVCLVVKDQGTQTFYRYGNERERLLQLAKDPQAPRIVYREDDLAPGQLASLYTACDCLVLPYRGEGFGLPVLEALACGLPVMVTGGGATDDFVREEFGWRLPSQEVPGEHEWPLCGPALEREVATSDLRQALREASQNRAACREKGRAGSRFVQAEMTWQQTCAQMRDRLQQITSGATDRAPDAAPSLSRIGEFPMTISAPVAQDVAARQELQGQLPEPWLVPWIPVSGQVFVDVGANRGLWSRALAGRFQRVHAVEPNPDVQDALRASLPDNVTVHPVAAWDRTERLRFSRFAQDVHLSAVFGEEGGIHTGPRLGQLELPAQTLDSLPLSGPVDFLKCDAEGAEVECLLGAVQLIQRDHPWLLVELHTAENFRAVARLLVEWGYDFTVIRDPYYEPYSPLWYAHCWLSAQFKLSAAEEAAA